MEQYLDQRIVNTKQDLFKALFKVLKTSTTIKVLDICKQANITPMTFYHHYSDKTQLIQEAIDDQLDLRLPIPVKLKPNNLKQLMYYIIRFFSEFFNNNRTLLISIFNNLYKIIKNTYLDLLIKTICNFFNKELQKLFNYQQITLNIWNDFIVLGFTGLFLKRIIKQQNIEFDTIKNNFNLFINNYLNIN